jgi:hypothetical protein
VVALSLVRALSRMYGPAKGSVRLGVALEALAERPPHGQHALELPTVNDHGSRSNWIDERRRWHIPTGDVATARRSGIGMVVHHVGVTEAEGARRRGADRRRAQQQMIRVQQQEELCV